MEGIVSDSNGVIFSSICCNIICINLPGVKKVMLYHSNEGNILSNRKLASCTKYSNNFSVCVCVCVCVFCK